MKNLSSVGESISYQINNVSINTHSPILFPISQDNDNVLYSYYLVMSKITEIELAFPFDIEEEKFGDVYDMTEEFIFEITKRVRLKFNIKYKG